MIYILLFSLSITLAALSVLFTLQKRVGVRTSRIIAAFLPFLALLPYESITLAVAMIGLAFWATTRAVQACLPATTGIREFAAELSPKGNRRLPAHVMHYVVLSIGRVVLAFKSGDDDAAKADILAKRIASRDGAREAKSSIPGALGFGKLHWILLGVIFTVWIVLQLTHLATFATTFTASVPTVLLTACWILYGNWPAFEMWKPRPRTSEATVQDPAV